MKRACCWQASGATGVLACGFVVLTTLGLSPALSLVLGVLCGVILGPRSSEVSGVWAGKVLRASVVLLGFGLSFRTVMETGRASLLPSLVSILAILVVGWLLGRFLGVEQRLAFLISGGTAICGGSAIASLAPAIGAGVAETGLSMAVVFLLNGLSLFVFPAVGAWLGLSTETYAQWCALGIHDTSSVAAAAASMGREALGLAISIKLTRALWIIPIGLVAARVCKGQGGVRIPWFMGGFVLASGLTSLFPGQTGLWAGLSVLGHHALGGAVFLVGAGIRLGDLRHAGRALVQGVILWLAAALVLLLCLR